MDRSSFDDARPGASKAARQSTADGRRLVHRNASRSWLQRLEAVLLRRLLQRVGDPPLTVEYAGRPVVERPRASGRLRILDRKALWRILFDPQFHFTEAYAEGRLEIDGQLADVLVELFRSIERRPQQGAARQRPALPRRRHGNSLRQSRHNIHHHYDIGNDFYQLWLDEHLVYTCAYFAEPNWTLEQAQVAKLDHVCRKLRLQRGQTVLEAGCGWGALALHMARHYGVKVRAFNISHEQVAWARGRARREGLDEHVEFIEDDWRNMRGPCDAFVSVGMLEHVGLQNFRELGEVVHRCLAPEGLALIHTIGRNRPVAPNSWIERRIFPGGYPPALSEMAAIFEPCDFSILDVENLRLHYADTLRHWLQRFEQSLDAVRSMFDERFVRMWRMYLSSSIAAFETGAMQLFQVVFAGGGNNRVPRTRGDLYAQRAAAADGANGQQRLRLPAAAEQ